MRVTSNIIPASGSLIHMKTSCFVHMFFGLYFRLCGIINYIIVLLSCLKRCYRYIYGQYLKFFFNFHGSWGLTKCSSKREMLWCCFIVKHCGRWAECCYQYFMCTWFSLACASRNKQLNSYSSK